MPLGRSQYQIGGVRNISIWLGCLLCTKSVAFRNLGRQVESNTIKGEVFDGRRVPAFTRGYRQRGRLIPYKARESRGPCVVENCGGFNGSYYTEPMLWRESMLCHYAKLGQTCNSEMFQETSAVTAIGRTCRQGRGNNLLSMMFGTRTCKKTDLCLPAAARLAMVLTACGSDDNGTIGAPLNKVICKEPKHAQEQAHRRLCHEMSNDFGNPRRATKLMSSLQCECTMLKPPSSRSKAVIQRTMDELYIVKRIDEDHAVTLSEIALPQDQPVLNPILYFDRFRQVVVIPNAFSAKTFGLAVECQGCQQPITFRNVAGWDSKPLPCKSAERPILLAYLVERSIRLRYWQHWGLVTAHVASAVTWAEKLGLTDYSLLTAVFALEENSVRQPLASDGVAVQAPNSKCLISPICKSSDPKLCSTICVTVIDYLMKYDIWRRLESRWKQDKWENYDKKTLALWRCLGDLTEPGCEKYLQLGCSQLSIQEPHAWCQAPTSTGGLPPSVWVTNGCVPDDKWIHQADNCKDYEDMPLMNEDLYTRDAKGISPMQACCLTVRNGYAYFANSEEVDEGEQEPPVLKHELSQDGGLPDRVWMSKGCIPDDDWETNNGDDDCIDYQGQAFTEEDWNARSADGRTPMEACCLIRTSGQVIYVDPDS